jgi:hypothetical protein
VCSEASGEKTERERGERARDGERGREKAKEKETGRPESERDVKLD